jgi:hypothetical protein
VQEYIQSLVNQHRSEKEQEVQAAERDEVSSKRSRLLRKMR